MSLNIFKPQRNGNGACCNIALNLDDKCFYVNLQRQVAAFDSPAPFKGGKRLTTKLSTFEAGQILVCIQRNFDQQMVHKTPEATTNIYFQRFFKWDDEKKAYTTQQLGYYISVTRTPKEGEKDTIRVGFTYGEAEVLRQYLIWSLGLIFVKQTEEQKVKAETARTNKAEKSAEKPVETPQDSEGVAPTAVDDGSL